MALTVFRTLYTSCCFLQDSKKLPVVLDGEAWLHESWVGPCSVSRPRQMVSMARERRALGVSCDLLSITLARTILGISTRQLPSCTASFKRLSNIRQPRESSYRVTWGFSPGQSITDVGRSLSGYPQCIQANLHNHMSLPLILSRLHNPIMHNIVNNRTIIMHCPQEQSLLSILPLPLPSHTSSPILLLSTITRRDRIQRIKHSRKLGQTPRLLNLARQHPFPLRLVLNRLPCFMLCFQDLNLLVGVDVGPSWGKT